MIVIYDKENSLYQICHFCVVGYLRKTLLCCKGYIDAHYTVLLPLLYLSADKLMNKNNFLLRKKKSNNLRKETRYISSEHVHK